jgi:Ser/Thr protein kinase RdoA (MazF antagonist)
MLATTALTQYDLDAPTITYHTFATNLLYRVTTTSGARYMLRLASPGWRTLTDLCSEALWIAALAHDTTIPVPVIMPTRSGEHVLPMRAAGVPDTWNVSLMCWVPGRNLGHYLTVGNLERMGRLFAELHQHGAAWNPPAGFTERRFEHWLSRGEENRIITNPQSSAISSHVASVVDTATCELLERMHKHVEAAYAAVDRSDLRVIHCDLWHDNIKLHKGVLHPFDFEDTVWGFRAHDIAMAMLDLLEDTDDERYPGLLAAFRHGYESLLDWPDDSIESFQMGRLLWKINWVARNQSKWLAYAIKRHVPVFEHYEQTGQVIRPPSGN